ncbi:pentapeptide repeat-containing protein [Mucilaginibacter sp.]|uniref:pentapeptide repeat-containing protein n=1 Tax=Mucilaginibacter sp. TaxID=1882438 RepID=UPI002610F45A|nr:pentapeptide repeat-containing protein [Mucilaginibacter sp.]MDB4925189.1 MCBG-like protein [Mucilaginibacter sp.]
METHDDKTFEEVSFAEKLTRATEYNNCLFKKCDLSNSDFMKCKFIDCIFDNCNLSMMKWSRSTLSNVVFKQCKILGVNFSLCEDFLFSVRFESSILDYSSFMNKKMLKTYFIKSSLKEVTFSQANIAGAVFDQSDLSGTVFSQTDLSSVNFSTALNYTLDPELNNINKAIFSADGLPGLLSKYNIKIV